MKFLIMHHGDEATEAGGPPSMALMARMGQFMAEETRAGVLLAAEGCLPSALGARVQFSNGQRTVTDGPFVEAKEVVAGFALIRAGSKAEAIEAATRFANVFEAGQQPDLVLMQVFDPEDLGPA